jgi:hypothetical protein
MLGICLHLHQMTKIRTYSELRQFDSFYDRFKYLSLRGDVGERTFGFDRWINQQFYKSKEWRDVRTNTIVRDSGCDLGVSGFEIFADLLVHHMNPLTVDAIENGDSWILDPEFLITTSLNTHNAIHFGDERLLPRGPIERKPGDTTLW